MTASWSCARSRGPTASRVLSGCAAASSIFRATAPRTGRRLAGAPRSALGVDDAPATDVRGAKRRGAVPVLEAADAVALLGATSAATVRIGEAGKAQPCLAALRAAVLAGGAVGVDGTRANGWRRELPAAAALADVAVSTDPGRIAARSFERRGREARGRGSGREKQEPVAETGP